MMMHNTLLTMQLLKKTTMTNVIHPKIIATGMEKKDERQRYKKKS